MKRILTPEQLKALFAQQRQQPDRGAVMRDLLRQPAPQPAQVRPGNASK
jgi:hypothetical protein